MPEGFTYIAPYTGGTVIHVLAGSEYPWRTGNWYSLCGRIVPGWTSVLPLDEDERECRGCARKADRIFGAR